MIAKRRLDDEISPQDAVGWSACKVPEPARGHRPGESNHSPKPLSDALERVMLEVVKQGYPCVRKEFRDAWQSRMLQNRMKQIAQREKIPVSIRVRQQWVFIVNASARGYNRHA